MGTSEVRYCGLPAGHLEPWCVSPEAIELVPARGADCCGRTPRECTCAGDFDDDHPDTIGGAEPGSRYGT